MMSQQFLGNSKRCIALDFSCLDHLSLGNGQYRYVVNLVKGLSSITPDNIELLLFGSKPDPVFELKDLFDKGRNTKWTYCQIPPWHFRGAYYLNHLRYPAIISFRKIHLWHALHTFVPCVTFCPKVVTIQDVMYEQFEEYQRIVQSRIYKIEKWILKNRVDHFIASSQSTKEDLNDRWGVPSEKISVAYHGTNFKDVNADTNSDIARMFYRLTKPVLFSPYNLELRKNLPMLLKALPVLLQKYPDLNLVLYGKAAWTVEREEEFKKLIQNLRLEDHIIFTGYISDVDLAFLYEQSDAFIFPSLYEGFGFPVLEAMSKGACVIAFNTSSIKEVVGNGGVLVDPVSTEGLARAIFNLLNVSSLKIRMRQLARERANLFSIQTQALRTWQIYQSVLSSVR